MVGETRKGSDSGSMDAGQVILLVDDSSNDVSLMRSACRAAKFRASLRAVDSGEETIAYLAGRGQYANRREYPLPTLILLDLAIPRGEGFEVLEWIRRDPYLRRTPVIILTGSDRPDDVARAFDLGANAYLVKPMGMSGLIAMTCCLRDWLEYNKFPPPRN